MLQVIMFRESPFVSAMSIIGDFHRTNNKKKCFFEPGFDSTANTFDSSVPERERSKLLQVFFSFSFFTFLLISSSSYICEPFSDCLVTFFFFLRAQKLLLVASSEDNEADLINDGDVAH